MTAIRRRIRMPSPRKLWPPIAALACVVASLVLLSESGAVPAELLAIAVILVTAALVLEAFGLGVTRLRYRIAMWRVDREARRHQAVLAENEAIRSDARLLEEELQRQLNTIAEIAESAARNEQIRREMDAAGLPTIEELKRRAVENHYPNENQE